ncbi:DUF547 domain-containing protein [Bizionia sp. KMM 8389]
MKSSTFILTFVCTLSLSVFSQKVNHDIWNSFLQKQVTNTGAVNYKSIKENPEQLNLYLQEFKKTVPNKNWTKNDVLAYWINAYNAFTIKLIIDNYPVSSIKDIKKPWDQEFIVINNKTVSLNYIEHTVLRKMNEPRIHFAIVCASASCPKLQNKAYFPETLNTQLTAATEAFLADDSKNTIKNKEVELSKIFKWFSKDFKEQGSLISFLNTYSNIKIASDAKIDYKDYSWELND